jgi:hypothetical protein
LFSHHFKTNDTTADDSHLLWHLGERNSASAGDNFLLVDGQAGERCRLRAGGDDDVLAANGSFATFDEIDSNGVLILECASALDVFDVVLLEEELNSLCKTRNGRVLGLHHGGEVELDIADLDTAVLRVVEDLVVELRVVEERLGGDAADVQAGSAEGATLLDTGDLMSRVSLPFRCFSRSVWLTFMPACPALMAATYPATPPPMITRSLSSAQQSAQVSV